MVHGHKSLFFVRPLEHGEVDHPKAGKCVLIAQSETVAHFKAQLAQLLARTHSIIAAHNQYQIARVGSHSGFELLQGVLIVEFIDGGLDIAVIFDTCVYEALGADLRTTYVVGKLIQLFARVRSGTGRADSTDICGVIKHAETMAFKNTIDFDKAHSEAQVGFVAAIILHCIGPRHTQKGVGQFDAAKFLENVLGHAFERLYDVFLTYKGHLAVYLREFGLSVSTEVLVTETLHNLKVTVHAGDHQKLLEGLWRLWQCIELSGVHTRRHHKIACALGGRAYKHGGLDFEKSERIEVAAHFHSHAVA